MKIDNKIDLNGLRLFVSVVESTNLSAAARREGMTRANVSRHLKNLETSLGAQLMRRTTRHMELTEAGHLLYQHGSRMLEEMETARASIDSLGKTVRGKVRLRLPTGLAHLHLAPLLLEFAARYPDIALRVSINDNIGDLISAEVDVALKITSSPPVDHVARKVCDIDWCLCASPEFGARELLSSDLGHAARLDWLMPASLGNRVKLRVRETGQEVVLQVTLRIQSGDYPFLLQGALFGLGVTLLPRYAVWKELRDGRLVEVMTGFEPEGVGQSIYLLTAPNRYPTLAMRAVMEFLRDALRDGAWRQSPVKGRGTPSE